MDSSAISSEMPPGLEYLIHIDHILIHQQFEFVEAILGFETANKYKIQNQLGQKVYYAVEESNFFTRNCCGDSRSFSMRILDNSGHEVILLNRPLRCSSCFCPCCLQKIEVQAPPGVTIGYVVQTWHPCLPTFTVQNEKNQAVLKIAGPCITCSFGGNIDFEIMSLDEKIVIGRISKHWSGFLKELLTDVDSFGIQFPLDLDVKMKAVMLGACFLIMESQNYMEIMQKTAHLKISFLVKEMGSGTSCFLKLVEARDQNYDYFNESINVSLENVKPER